MKSILSLFAILSFLPVAVNAKGRALPVEKAPSPVVIPTNSAFPTPAIHPKSESWKPNWLLTAKKVSSREAIQAINRCQPSNEKDTNFLATVLKNTPAISAKLQQKQFSAEEAKDTNDALIAAATQAVKENWSSSTKENVIKFSKALALNPLANKEMLEKVKENCIL